MNSIFQKLRDTLPLPERKLLQPLLLLAGVVLSLCFVMTSIVWDVLDPGSYVTGDIAQHTVRSPRNFLVEDTLSSAKNRSDAARGVRRVFILLDGADMLPSHRLANLFAAIKDSATEHPDGRPLSLSKEKRIELERRFGLDLVGEEWEVMLSTANWPRLEAAIDPLITPILKKGVVADKTKLRRALEAGGAVLRQKSNGTEHEILSENSVYDPLEAEAAVRMSYPDAGYGYGIVFDGLARKLALFLIQPNLFFDSDETDRRINAAVAAVLPTYNRILRGQVLVRAGDIVSSAQAERLRALRDQQSVGEVMRMAFGYCLLSALVLVTIFGFFRAMWPGFTATMKDLGLMSAALIGSFLLLKVFTVLGIALGRSYPALGTESVLLATPFAAGGILIQALLGAPFLTVFAVSFALLASVFLEQLWSVVLLIVVGNFIGAHAVKRATRRSSFIVAGLRVAISNALVVGSYLLFYPAVSTSEDLTQMLAAAIGGLLSGILAGGLAPVAEFLGGYITGIKLLELASLDRPLLRDLSLQAPGTWNHSMMMAQLGEAAADAIGAHGLLTRVGAYYHDVGKTKKPLYFVENQKGGENRHDRLAPSMSALIIKSHVKDGIEMAEEHRLPQALIDFIPQHHGTALIEYFYVKALKEAEDGGELVDESHYRYAGPKPQTKEAGILMLADAVEAASRTLSDPSPAKIQGLVQKIINKVFVSGELGQSNLTLRDLHLIAKAFTRVLTGVYHRRVEYSEPAEKKCEPKIAKFPAKERNEAEEQHFAGQRRAANSRYPGEAEGGKPAKEGTSKKGSGPETGDTLKRLGM